MYQIKTHGVSLKLTPPGRVEIGYIAEDMADLGLKHLVSYDKAGEVENFNYEKMILYVVEVLKDQQKTIEGLRAELAELKSQK